MEFIQIILIIVLIMMVMLTYIIFRLKYHEQIDQLIAKLFGRRKV